MLIKPKVGSLKSLVKLINTRQTFQEKREKMQIMNIILKSEITTEPIDFNKMEYYVQIFVSKFYNLLKMNKSFQRNKLTKLTQDGIENLNRL